MIENSEKIVLPSKPVKEPMGDLSSPVFHSANDYNFNAFKGKRLTGKGVKVAIVDSGAPVHPDITNITEHVDLLHDTKDARPYDLFGHATMVAGVLGANSKKFRGIAPNVNFYAAKVSSDDGVSDFNALVAGVLWAVVRQVDIIVIALSTSVDYPVFYNAIKKAYDENICVVVAAENDKDAPSYPAYYPEALGFIVKPKNKNASDGLLDVHNNVIVQIPSNGIMTTCGKDQYIRVYGSSFAAAIGAGLLACVIEQRGNKPRSPDELYKDIFALGRKS
tara:strand:- start:646 stop:1476 length:831 start_codon:yes stop_codon:yes gene_type:complete